MSIRYAKSKKQLKKFYLKYALIVVAAIFGVILLVQICYPSSNLPLNTKLGGKNLSGWDKKTAIKELNRAYENAEIEIFLDSNEDNYKTVFPENIGLEVDNTNQINNVSYPWYIRLVPTSLFWWGTTIKESDLSLNFDEDILDDYIEKTFGMPCYVEPKNASLAIDGNSVNINKSSVGGSCYQSVVKEAFRDAEFVSSNSGTIQVDLEVELPDISTDDAQELAMEISPNLVNDLVFKFDEMEETVTLGHDELTSWVTFEVVDKKLIPKIDEKKSSEFYKTRIAPLVEQSAGVTTIIATEDINTVRLDGVEGRVINIEETNLRIAEYLRGLRKTVTVALESTDPSINYVYNRPESNQVQPQTEAETSENQDLIENTTTEEDEVIEED